jgi:hypothetical protein
MLATEDWDALDFDMVMDLNHIDIILLHVIDLFGNAFVH